MTIQTRQTRLVAFAAKILEPAIPITALFDEKFHKLVRSRQLRAEYAAFCEEGVLKLGAVGSEFGHEMGHLEGGGVDVDVGREGVVDCVGFCGVVG